MMLSMAGSLLAFLAISVNFVNSQTQSVSLCPLYLALQNRCPTQSTTLATSTVRTSTTPLSASDSDSTGNGTDSSSNESDVVDSCGLPTVSFCPAMLTFLPGGRNCTDGQSIEIRLVTLGRLLVNPSNDRAARTVGASNVNALGDTLTSISRSIQATPTQATIGVTFIPVGQIIG